MRGGMIADEFATRGSLVQFLKWESTLIRRVDVAPFSRRATRPSERADTPVG
jgi:hypothetical protein